MLYAAEDSGGWLHDTALIATSATLLIVVVVVVLLLLSGRVRIVKFSLKELSFELTRADSGKELGAAIAAVNEPLAAANYTSYAQSIVKAATVPSRLEVLHADLALQPGWLTSRLYFMVVLLERMRGLRCVVFEESGEGGAPRFIGLATPAAVRWSLARLYPWLEEAFAAAYARLSDGDPQLQRFRPSSTDGALGVDAVGLLLTPYLQKIQTTQKHDPGPGEWTRLASAEDTWERAVYVRGGDVENLLGEVLSRATVRHDLPQDEKIKAVLLQGGEFVAVVGDHDRLQGLANRRRWVEEAARYVAQKS
jgi:hypothetical protein